MVRVETSLEMFIRLINHECERKLILFPTFAKYLDRFPKVKLGRFTLYKVKKNFFVLVIEETKPRFVHLTSLEGLFRLHVPEVIDKALEDELITEDDLTALFG